MSALIVGCIACIIAACIIVPPVGWALAAIVGTAIAFAGDSRG